MRRALTAASALPAVILTSVLALTGLVGLAGPAGATTPASCHLTAGKFVAGPSTATRSISLRWPGAACTTGWSVRLTVDLQTLSGNTWSDVQVASINHSTPSLPAGSMTAHCTHQATVREKVKYFYTNGVPGDGGSAAYYSPNGRCS